MPILIWMENELQLKDDYQLAGCCNPSREDQIVGYYSYDRKLKVHRQNCGNLTKAETERLVSLDWQDILMPAPFEPDEDFKLLDATDFAVLKHHSDYDIDYSLMVAKMVNIPKEDAFERHSKLKELGLLERVNAVMVRYRKGVVDNKWIKHRNHTYYRLSDRGRSYLKHYETNL